MQLAPISQHAREVGISSGSGMLRGTWLFDFDAGIETANMRAADVWWEQKTAVLRDMVPMGGASLVNLGPVNICQSS